MTQLQWVTAFLDLPGPKARKAERFWAAVTGSTLSPRRGEHDEFATLLPPEGDPYLKVQDVSSGGVHLDLHVDDAEAAAREAVHLGAQTQRRQPGLVVLTSPGGLGFCFVEHDGGSRTPPPMHWPDSVSRVGQVCIDAPADVFGQEVRFWEAMTGWRHDAGSPDEFEDLVPPPGMPLRILMQRLDERAGIVRAHLDVSSVNREAEVARHVALGAVVAHPGRGWTTLSDPAGQEYCVTDRDPSSNE